MTCTQQQAEDWLKVDIQWAADAVSHLVKAPLTQGEFNGLTDSTYNLGYGSLEHSTLLKLLNAGDYHRAAAEIIKWNKAGGKVCAGILRWRQAETVGDLFSLSSIYLCTPKYFTANSVVQSSFGGGWDVNRARLATLRPNLVS